MKKSLLTLFIILFVSCTKTKEIDFEMVNNLPVIDVEINGIPVKLLVDSGASLSLIDTTLESHLNFGWDSNIPVSVGQGMGGIVYIYGLKDISLTHKGDTLNVIFKGTNLSGIRFSTGVTGVIGSDFLSKNKLIIDYKDNKLKEIVLD